MKNSVIRLGLISCLISLFVNVAMATLAQASTTEISTAGKEKIVISVPEGVMNIAAKPGGQNLRVRLLEAAQDDYMVVTNQARIEIISKDSGSKENFGKVSGKKHVIEIQGPDLPLEIHAFEGQVEITAWSKEALIHLQKGKIISRDGTGTLNVHSQSGEIRVANHQGRLDIDTYKSLVSVKELTGDAEVANFSGETLVDKAKGFLSLNQGQGTAKIDNSSGTLQFDLTKGILSVQKFAGRIEGQTQEGPINVVMAPEGEVNIKSQTGRITIHCAPQSGALLNLASVEGDILVPNYLKVSRDGSQKTLRGRLKGDVQKGSVVVRSQEGSIIIR